MTALPRLKARVKLNFPAVVSGVDGIDVTKENGTYSIGLGIDSLEDTGALTTANFGDFNVPVYNEQTGIYTKLPLDTLRDGISADFPVSDAAFVLEDDGDTTKKLQFQLSGITTATTRTLTVPDASTTIVGTDTTQTLSNKTLTAPEIGAATGTSLTLSGALIVGTDATIGASSVYAWAGRTLWSAPANGQALLTNAAGTDFSRLQLGGTTSSYPAIKRNGAALDFRKADDSAYANIAAAQGSFTGNVTAVGTTAIPAGGTQDVGYLFSATGHFGLIFGSGAPSASMAQGSMYLRSDGLPYYNTNGTTGWDALVGVAASQTLTNKTLTSPVISTISNTGTLTLPTSTDTLVGRATTDTLSNKTFVAPALGAATGTSLALGGATLGSNILAITGAVGASGAIRAQNAAAIGAGGTAGTGFLFSSTANFGLTYGSGSPTLSVAQGSLYLQSDGLPAYNTNGTTGWDTLVGRTATQTLTNKTLTSPAITTPTGIVKGDVGLGNVDNTSDATKNAAVATLTNKTITAPVISTITNTGTLTLPTSTDTLVGRATTDTLTNKTISGSSNTLSNISNSSLATAGAYTIKGNATGSSATPTDIDIALLTTKASPAAGDYVLLSDQAASGAFKKATISSIATAGSVSSIAGNTGAFTLSTGITNSGNDIRIDRGQLPGTTTNDDATSGNIGETLMSGAKGFSQSTVTMTIASPCVVTWTSHGLSTAMPVHFTTTGALPTGLTASTNYYVIKIDANTFWLATTATNALAGTKINTSGSQSGTHTALGSANLTTVTAACVNALQLTAGDWVVWASTAHDGDSATAMNVVVDEINSSEAGFSQVPGTFGKISGYDSTGTPIKPFTSSSGFVVDEGPTRKTLSGSGTVFLTSFAQFSGGNMRASGMLMARRAR